MNQAENIIPRLRELSELERTRRQLEGGGKAEKSIMGEIESLRDLLPTSILAHHDSFSVRGKSSTAPVSGGVCGACHLALTRGRVADLRRGPANLSVCDSCGVFIYLAEEPPAPPIDAAFFKVLVRTKTNTQSKRTKRRAKIHAPKSPDSR